MVYDAYDAFEMQQQLFWKITDVTSSTTTAPLLVTPHLFPPTHHYVFIGGWSFYGSLPLRKKWNLPNNSQKKPTIPNNIRIHVLLWRLYVIDMSDLKTKDLDLIHIEQYHSHNMKIQNIVHNVILICATRFCWLQFSKLGLN